MEFPKIPGAELLLVGGSVRDTLLGRASKDRDFIVDTKLSFDELVREIEASGATIFQEKPEFLTIRAKFGKETIDIAFPRSDGNYTDARHPDETQLATIKQDASRRDFTINAMYMRESGEILDYYNGQKDLSDKMIRAVGNPADRFREDALRILRAMRFEAKLGFRIEQATWIAMYNYSHLLSTVVPERIQQELDSTFNSELEYWTIARVFQNLLNLSAFDVLEKKGVRFRATLAPVRKEHRQ